MTSHRILHIGLLTVLLLAAAGVHAQSVPEPSIAISPDYFYPFEEILYLEGRGAPNAVVTVLLQKQGDKPVKFTVKADSSGEWVVAEKTFLASGNWEVRARQRVGSDDSGWSNPRIIRSVVTGVNFLGVNVRYAVIALILLVFLIVIGIILFAFTRRIRALKRNLFEKEVHETEERFRRGFAEIRKDLTDELRALMENAQGRALTTDEIARQEHILRELQEIERNFSQDISNIEKRYQ